MDLNDIKLPIVAKYFGENGRYLIIFIFYYKYFYTFAKHV
jgi:hypothetical protein